MMHSAPEPVGALCTRSRSCSLFSQLRIWHTGCIRAVRGTTQAQSHLLLSLGGLWTRRLDGGTALEQLKSVARMNDCVSVVGMPDLHAGGGIPIGAVAAFSETIYPHLVGSDAGCGARLVLVKAKEVGLDKLERRLHSAMDHAPWEGLDEKEILRTVWQQGARGLSTIESLPDDLREMASAEAPLPESEEIPERYLDYASSLGTIGGGNHFLEVTKVTEVASAEHRHFAKSIGVLAHSGSRGLGYAMANHWGKRPLMATEQAEYLKELEGAVRYAQANRLLLTYRGLRALGAAKASKELLRVDVTHNTVRRETQAGRNTWVHRKGAAPAHEGQLTLEHISKMPKQDSGAPEA